MKNVKILTLFQIDATAKPDKIIKKLTQILKAEYLKIIQQAINCCARMASNASKMTGSTWSFSQHKVAVKMLPF